MARVQLGLVSAIV